MYRSIAGLEDCEFTRFAYAIEYDCIDTLDVLPTLEFKKVKGLYTAGQINGTSGYEEAAAQGLIAGLNASLAIRGKEPLILRRDQAYIGVLIDDLITKGVDEPYRMFTSRAEHRILLRQDDADMRLTPLGHELGLVDERRYELCESKRQYRDSLIELCRNTSIRADRINPFLESHACQPLRQGVKLIDLVLRPQLTIALLCESVPKLKAAVEALPSDRREEIVEAAEILMKYDGYIQREKLVADKLHRLENVIIEVRIDYESVNALSTEARQKLSRQQPRTIGQASRIPGVSPSDINILLLMMGR